MAKKLLDIFKNKEFQMILIRKPFHLCLHMENWRWKGVPFYLRSGKRLAMIVRLWFSSKDPQKFSSEKIRNIR